MFSFFLCAIFAEAAQTVLDEIENFNAMHEAFLRGGHYGPESIKILSWLLQKNRWTGTDETSRSWLAKNKKVVIRDLGDEYGYRPRTNPFLSKFVECLS